MIQKFASYPAQIGPVLRVDRHAWPDTGMNEQIIVHFDLIGQDVEKIDMLTRNIVQHPCHDLFIGHDAEQ